MILYFDIGNTRAKYALSGSLKNENTHGHNAELTIDAIDNELLTTQWLSENFTSKSVGGENLESVVVASVNDDQQLQMLKSWTEQQQAEFIYVATEKSRFGLINSYQDVEQMGVDRWRAMVGAVSCFPNQTIIVIDAGTATTLELIDNKGNHIGGWILPGIATMLESLVGATSKVHAKPSLISNLNMGTNTSDCVNNALWAATLGLIASAKQVAKKNNLTIERTIITGGNGQQLSQLVEESCEFIPALVFYGLQRYSQVTTE